MVYLPTFTIKNQLNVGKYTSPMDPQGLIHPQKKGGSFLSEPFLSATGC